MRLLIADRLRRTNPLVILFIAAFAGGMWWAGPYFEQPGRAMTTSMAIMLMAGPQTVLWDPLESTCRHASLSIL